jgi:hypothetical protein
VLRGPVVRRAILARFPSAALGAIVVYAAVHRVDVSGFRRAGGLPSRELLLTLAAFDGLTRAIGPGRIFPTLPTAVAARPAVRSRAVAGRHRPGRRRQRLLVTTQQLALALGAALLGSLFLGWTR